MKIRLMMSVLMLLLLLLLAFGFQNVDSTSTDANLQTQNEDTNGEITIEYPLNRAVFPIEIPSPTIIWKQQPSERARSWHIRVASSQGNSLVEMRVHQRQWKPTQTEWSAIAKAALDEPVFISVQSEARPQSNPSTQPPSIATVSIRTSADSVDAPIFFREVPLPFDYANQYPEKIRYRIGHVSDAFESKVLLEELPLCGNCHSFSRDGRLLGMDVDYANDKGSYVITELARVTALTSEKMITWSDYQKEDKTPTFGLLSQVSPSGQHVVSTVKDRSIFVGIKENQAYSQLFFPIKGILAVYDREAQTFASLPGADDADFVQSNPAWTPDGETLFFTRARAYHSSKIEGSNSVVLPREAASEFIEGKKKFRYDIYKVPFNNGEGGEALPLVGASKNGKSNYFPKVTPDGKWVVFAQADSFMLLQEDSRLYIVPAEGGEAREMQCNTSNMNSWHSFSPNGRWMVFSSKERGAYTQLWMTHLDANGVDSPPILLAHLMTKNMAANIPEFVNIAPDALGALVDRFSNGGNYHYRIAKNLVRYNDLNRALKELNRAAEKQPNDPEIFLERGALLYRMKKVEPAIRDFNKVLDIAPNDYRGPFNLALAQEGIGDLDSALEGLNAASALHPDSIEVLSKRAMLKLKRKDAAGAIADLNTAVSLRPKMASLYNLRGDMKSKQNDMEDALADYNTAIALDPQMGAAYLNRSYLYLAQNDFVLARRDLGSAKKFSPNAPLAVIIEAVLALKTGYPQRGCKRLRQARRSGHTQGYGTQIQQLIETMCQ